MQPVKVTGRRQRGDEEGGGGKKGEICQIPGKAGEEVPVLGAACQAEKAGKVDRVSPLRGVTSMLLHLGKWRKV